MKALRLLFLGSLPLAVFGACSSEDPAPPTVPQGAATITSGGVTSTTGGTTTGDTAASSTSTTGVAAVNNTTGTSAVTSDGTVSSTTGDGTASTTGGLNTSTTGFVGGTTGSDMGSTTGMPMTGAGGGASTTGGETVSTTGEPALTLPDLVGDLDGRLVMTPCGDTPNTDDCGSAGWITNTEQGTNSCEGGQLTVELEHPIGGTMDAVYNLTLHFYAITETKNYGAGGLQREAGNGRPSLDGGTPTGWATAPGDHSYPGSNYNTYEIRVSNAAGDEQEVYYLNADTQEGHFTMIVDYEKTIPVYGGGSVLLKIYDANCRQIKNCGSTAGYPCDGKARSLDLAAADPQPMGLDQPGLGQGANHSGQWIYIDAISFTEG
jgi:hypothetical protein